MKAIRDRVIEIATDVIEREFLAVCAEDRLDVHGGAVAQARRLIRLSLDGLGDCRSFERMTDAVIRREVTPHLRAIVRDALAGARPS